MVICGGLEIKVMGMDLVSMKMPLKKKKVGTFRPYMPLWILWFGIRCPQ